MQRHFSPPGFDSSILDFSVGCFGGICRDRLAGPLVSFSMAWPDLNVGVHEMGFAELPGGVASGRLALALRPGAGVEGFASVELWPDRAVVAMAPDHPLAAAPDITIDQLAGAVLLVSRDRAREQLHRFLIDRLFPKVAAPATRIVADARRSQLLARVAAGEGLTLLCESQVDAAMAQLAVRPVAADAAQFRVRALWLEARRDAPLSTLIEQLEQSREGWFV